MINENINHPWYVIEARKALEEDFRRIKEEQELREKYKDEVDLVALLFRARRDKHLTQAQLATKTGLKKSAIIRFEKGRTNPSLRTLNKIAKALDKKIVII